LLLSFFFGWLVAKTRDVIAQALTFGNEKTADCVTGNGYYAVTVNDVKTFLRIEQQNVLMGSKYRRRQNAEVLGPRRG